MMMITINNYIIVLKYGTVIGIDIGYTTHDTTVAESGTSHIEVVE